MSTPQSAPAGARLRRRLPTALLLLLPLVAFGVALFPSARPAEAGAHAGEAAAGEAGTARTQALADAYGKLPLQFEANRGQSDGRVRFISRGDGYVMFLTADEAVLALSRGDASEGDKTGQGGGYSVLRMKLSGASASPKVEGLEELPGRINYFVGHDPSGWRTGVPVYGKVHYASVYPGIDLVYYGNQRQLEYDFQVAPGADPRAIRIKFEGADRAEVDAKDGSLALSVGRGEVRMKRPVIYQVRDDGGREEVEGGYRVSGGEVEFSVGRYDARRPLVIDPILSYSTFLGVVNNLNITNGPALALDPSGAAYVTGAAGALAFPAPGVKLAPAGAFSSNVFVTKLNPSGSALVYTSYLGGFAEDAGLGIALDSAGAAYVTGRTSSGDFPTVNAVRTNDSLLKSADGGATWQAAGSGLQNRPLARLWADPSNASTLYALSFGALHKTADAAATWSPLPVPTPPASGGPTALAVTPTNPSVLYAGNGSTVVKSTDGGANWSPSGAGLPSSGVSGLSVDPSNPSVVFAGTYFDVYKTTDGGASWAKASTGINYGSVHNFVYDPTNSSVVYAAAGGGGGVFKTTDGGANWARSNNGLAANGVSAVVIDPTSPSTLYAATGLGVFRTNDGAANWAPVNNGLTNTNVRSLAFDPAAAGALYAGTDKGGVFKTTDGGASWARVRGGMARAAVVALAVGPTSHVYAGLDTNVNGFADSEAFVAKLGPAGDTLAFSTYLGGDGNDEGASVAVDSAGSAYVAGQTASSNFPAAGPRPSALRGESDAFVTRFSPAGTSLLFSTLVGGARRESGRSVALDPSGNAYVCGETTSADFPVTPGAFSTAYTGDSSFSTNGNDGFVFKLDPDGAALAYATFLGGNGDDRASDVAVDSAGHAHVAGSTTSSNFPTLNAVPGMPKGGAYATKLNPSGSALVYSTHLGPALAGSVALDAAGAAYLTGTASRGFPVTPDTLKYLSPLYRSNDSGANWRNDNTGLGAGSIAGNPGTFHDLVLDPLTPHVLYASSDDGVYKSTDGGRRWARSSNGLTAQRIVALAVDPKTPSTLYAGTGLFSFQNPPTLFKTTDGGANWSPLASSSAFQFVGALAVDPATTSNVYVYNGRHVVKSADGGATWNPPGAGSPDAVNTITVDPSNPSNVYAATDRGVFKTSDGGANWAPANKGLPNLAAAGRVVVDPSNTSVLYANTTGGVYKSTDGAASWALSLKGVYISRLIAVDPSAPSTVYAYVAQQHGSFNTAFTVYRSTDGGANWVALPAATTLPLNALAVDPFTRTNLYVLGNTFAVNDSDAFLLKLAPAGNAVVYATLLGGGVPTAPSSVNSNSDQGTSVAVDAQGAVYVAGFSYAADFPGTAGSFLAHNRGVVDAFVAKLVAAPSVGGVVTDTGGVPRQGVKITLTGSSADTRITGDDGTYLFTNLQAGGSYAVSATKAGSSFTPPSHGFAGLSADQTANFTLGPGAPSHRIAGRLSEAGGAPVAGATVALGGSQVELATTDAAGRYSFHAPDGGSYTVTPTALGFSFAPPSAAVNNLASDQALDFTATRVDFVVTNGADAGAGSLRQAILDANATPGADRITFNIPGAGVRTIALDKALPTVNGPLTIDGTTQPGYAGTPVVELTGAGILTASPGGVIVQGSGTGLVLTGGDSVVRGLCINGFGGDGIALGGGGNNRIEGNFIGLDPAGAAKRPNRGTGVSVGPGSTGNVIGGTSPAQRNVISGNDTNGVTLNSAGNFVRGNYIGTDAAGAAALGNGGATSSGWGVAVGNFVGHAASGNVVGGLEAGARNVISSNSGGGVEASGSGTIIQGNYIGTDAAGANKLPNPVGVRVTAPGVVIGGTTPAARNVISGNGQGIFSHSTTPAVTIKGNYVGTDAAGAARVGNATGVAVFGPAVVGGAEPGAGNLISGNEFSGVQLGCCGPAVGPGSGASVKGNFIGTDATGTRPLGNLTGIHAHSSHNVIGGAEPGARNVVSANDVGINIGDTNSTGPSGNLVLGNLIGTDAAGAAPLGNRWGGVQFTNANGNTVGGDAPGEGNTIAFGWVGVTVTGQSVNNTVKGNSVFSNVQVGLNLTEGEGAPGRFVTPNDAGDADEGANHLQNFPVVTSATAVGGGTNVRGSLDGKPDTQFRLDFYSSLACSPSGHGEGARPLGTAQVTTDAAGAAAFDVTLAGHLDVGRAVTATATDPAGNTSEFSPCDASAAAGRVEFAALDLNVLEDVGAALVRVVRVGGGRGPLTVSYNVGGGTADAGADYTPASGQLTFDEGETEKTFAVPVADDGAAEPEETVVLSLGGTPELESLGGRARATLHIFDSATPLTLTPDDVTFGGILFAEGDAGTRNAVVTVRLSAATSRTVTVDYATTAWAAAAGADFIPVAGTLTFAPGVETRDIRIPIVGDTVDEFDEPLILDLKDPSGAALPFARFEVVIVDDDAPPAASVTDVTVAEGAGARAVFALRLSRPSGKNATITYQTSDGTAAAGSDYTATSGGVLFAPGETVRTVEVPVSNDGAAEGEETFTLNIGSTSQERATVADAQGRATIIDAAASAALVQFAAPSYAVGEADGRAVVTVTRTGDASQPAAVDYRTIGQSADERADFTASLGTLRFAPGETQKTFAVLVTDDRFREPAESLDLVLSNPAGAALGGPGVAALTITSDDASDGQSPVRDDGFDAAFFVRQHYADFLNREPDAPGLAFWKGDIEACGTDRQCLEVKRINVSAAFFLSIEFQETGYLVYRAYKAAYGDATSPGVPGTVPVVRLDEFLPDSRRIGEGVVVNVGEWRDQLEANKNAYMAEFVQRRRFLDAFPPSMTAAQFVDKLNQNAGGVLSEGERDALVAELAGAPDQTLGRAAALRRVSEDDDLKAGEKNRAFVLMQYFGYLRRNPDDPQDTDFRGWRFWLSKLEEFDGNFVGAEMVKAFITSDEYRNRFGR